MEESVQIKLNEDYFKTWSKNFEAFPDKNMDAETLQNAKFKKTKQAVAARKKAFIDEYRKSYCVHQACETVGITLGTYYRL